MLQIADCFLNPASGLFTVANGQKQSMRRYGTALYQGSATNAVASTVVTALLVL